MDTIQALHRLILATQGPQGAQAFLQEVRGVLPPGGRLAREQWQRGLDALEKP